MTAQGDAILKEELETAIDALSQTTDTGVCAAHSTMAHGIKVLLLCKKSEMKEPGWQGKARTSAKWTTLIGALGTAFYAALKAHGLVP